jgi:hypothetical protein
MPVELFRTVVPVSPSGHKISYTSPSLMFGSCFTENMGEKLSWYKFPVAVNPFGITYNPLSVRKNLNRLLSGTLFGPEELNRYQGVYFSFDHHSRFSDANPEICLGKINASLETASGILKKASHLFLTFGTAYYYELKSDRQVVNNCHKLPEKEFSRFRLNPEEIVTAYSELIPLLKAYNPELTIVFTISPIRHWKDGAHENQLSKSVLFIAVDEICRKFKICIFIF